MDRETVAAEVEAVLTARVRPMLKSHGGGIAVREIDERGVVRLAWLGACTGCPLRPITTAGLVQPELEAIHGVTEVDTGFRVSKAAAERLSRIHRG
jgi:Fe-S cluster biogenesis protein NfuA